MKTQIKNTKKVNSEVDVEKLSELSGESDTKSAPKFPLPSLKINGKTGGYYLTVLNKDGSLKTGDDGKALLEEVENPVGIILKPRKSFNFIGGDFQYFTNEGGNTPKANFVVFKKTEGKKGDIIQAVGEGTSAEIKTKFPELKMTQILYFLLKTDKGLNLTRFKVKGMSLGNLFEYWKEFSGTEHFFQYYTELGEENDKNQFGKFIKATFTKGETVKDFTEVRESLELIKEKVEAIEKYAAERNIEQEGLMGGVDEETAGTRPESRPLDEIRESLKLVNDEEEAEELSDKVSKKRKAAKDDSDEIDVASIPFG